LRNWITMYKHASKKANYPHIPIEEVKTMDCNQNQRNNQNNQNQKNNQNNQNQKNNQEQRNNQNR